MSPRRGVSLTVTLTCQREFLLLVQRLRGRGRAQEVPRGDQARSAQQRHASAPSQHRRAQGLHREHHAVALHLGTATRHTNIENHKHRPVMCSVPATLEGNIRILNVTLKIHGNAIKPQYPLLRCTPLVTLFCSFPVFTLETLMWFSSPPPHMTNWLLI